MNAGNKIVFVNQASGYLTIDIVNAFVNHFDKTAVISGIMREQDVPLDGRVEWVKINYYQRNSFSQKLRSWIEASFRIFWLVMTRFWGWDVFYITVPPMAYLTSLVRPGRFSILVFDLYPDVLAVNGITPLNPLYRFWAACNRRLFRRAHRLFTLSEGMKKQMAQYVDADKIEVIPNWTGLVNLRPVPRRENLFAIEQGLTEKFVVQYSGNIGATHNVERLVEVAELLRDRSDVFVLIIGRGEKFERIGQLIDEKKLPNCRLLPYQPDEMLQYTLSTADLSVVVIDDASANASMPSKTYNAQAVGSPILAIAPPHAELAVHLERFQNGRAFQAQQAQEMADYILFLAENEAERARLSQNSLRAAEGFTMANAQRYAQSYCSEK